MTTKAGITTRRLAMREGYADGQRTAIQTHDDHFTGCEPNEWGPWSSEAHAREGWEEAAAESAGARRTGRWTPVYCKAFVRGAGAIAAWLQRNDETYAAEADPDEEPQEHEEPPQALALPCNVSGCKRKAYRADAFCSAHRTQAEPS